MNLVRSVKFIIIQIRQDYGKKWHESLELLFSIYSIDNPNFVMSRFFNMEIKWKIQFGSSLMALPFARKVALCKKKKK